MPKRQRTEWHMHSTYDSGTFIRVGRIHNPKGVPRDDIIRLQIKGLKSKFDIAMRVDEAVVIASGLNKSIARLMLNEGKRFLRKK